MSVARSQYRGPARTFGEQPFLSENATAMHKMMGRHDIKPTGDTDRDFRRDDGCRTIKARSTWRRRTKFGRNEQLRGWLSGS